MNDETKEILLLLRFLAAHTIIKNGKSSTRYLMQLTEDTEFAVGVLESLQVFKDQEGQMLLARWKS